MRSSSIGIPPDRRFRSRRSCCGRSPCPRRRCRTTSIARSGTCRRPPRSSLRSGTRRRSCRSGWGHSACPRTAPRYHIGYRDNPDRRRRRWARPRRWRRGRRRVHPNRWERGRRSLQHERRARSRPPRPNRARRRRLPKFGGRRTARCWRTPKGAAGARRQTTRCVSTSPRAAQG
jgi:hypothetical protein